MVMGMMEGHLPGKLLLVTSVSKVSISRGTEGQVEMFLVVNNPRG